MDDSWVLVPDAARALNVSPQRVRGLLDSGALAGQKFGRSWLIDPVSVERRRASMPEAGRPMSAGNAWRLLHSLECRHAGKADLAGYASAVQGSRIRAALASLPEASELARRLAARASIARMRAHPGVLDRLMRDTRVSVGGSHAVGGSGGGIAVGALVRLYVRAADSDDVVAGYRLQDDAAGRVELAVVPRQVPDELLPKGGEFVSAALAWVDLIDDPDSRARAAAARQVRRWRR